MHLSVRWAAAAGLVGLALAGRPATAPGADPPGASMTPHARQPLPSPAEIRALPPDGGPHWNRLVFEQSPYLLQHAANPVDWYPWGEEAFERARREDKPVFLSIGYSTCHWCHVMERESFEDGEVAALLNESFVCIKVDREERPDVDHLYMTVTQALSGSGGWPMSVVLTPDARPFFAGTYFPKHGRLGRPGMMDLLPRLALAWADERDAVVGSASRITAALTEWTGSTPGTPPGATALEHAEAQLERSHDPVHGGFGTAPKFPSPHQLTFLLRRHARSGDAATLAMVERTLDAMRRGGLFDHVGFGFARYSTDREWLVPHFEKMLYDQALLAMAYAEAHEATGEDRHARVVREIAEYVLRDMTSPEGAFYSAEDADSEGEEGKFYLWTPEELREVLGRDEGDFVARTFGVTDEGNFVDHAAGGRTGRSILHLARPLEDVARGEGMSPAALEARWAAAREALREAREKRVRPGRDDKVLTDWNGLMIAALAKAGCVLRDPRLTQAAERAARFVLEHLRDERGRLLKRYRHGVAGLPAVLDDHAFLCWGLLELHQATQDPSWLCEALELAETTLRHFGDADGGLFLTADDGEPLLVRSMESHDGALPSGNSVMAVNLLRLGRIAGREDLERRADGILRAFAGSIERAPAAHGHLLQAVDFALGPGHEVVIVGTPGTPDVEALLAVYRERFRPRDVLVLRPADDAEAEEVVRLAPYTEHQRATDGRATAYACVGHACHAPTTDPGSLRALLVSELGEPGQRAE